MGRLAAAACKGRGADEGQSFDRGPAAVRRRAARWEPFSPQAAE